MLARGNNLPKVSVYFRSKLEAKIFCFPQATSLHQSICHHPLIFASPGSYLPVFQFIGDNDHHKSGIGGKRCVVWGIPLENELRRAHNRVGAPWQTAAWTNSWINSRAPFARALKQREAHARQCFPSRFVLHFRCSLC